MTVKELRTILDHMPDDYPVVCYTPHGSIRGFPYIVSIAKYNEGGPDAVFIEFEELDETPV